MPEAALAEMRTRIGQPCDRRRSRMGAEVVDAARVSRDEWDAALAASGHVNPFYSGGVMHAAMATIDSDAELQAIMLRRPDRHLAGIVPFRRGRIGPVACNFAAANRYQFETSPLINADAPEDAVGLFIQSLSSGTGGDRRPWLFRNIDAEGIFATRLETEAAKAGWRMVAVRTYNRPVLRRSAGSFSAHIKRAMSKNRAKGMARRIRRLRALGDLRLDRATAPADVEKRLDQFLALEHGGWKGAAGTSILSSPQDERFIRLAFDPYGAKGTRPIIDSLLLDGHPIAMLLNLEAGGRLTTPKCAYDERYRAYGPGFVLDYMVTEAFFEDDRFSEIDSATIAPDAAVDELWFESRRMADMLLVPNTPAGRLLCGSLLLRRRIVDRLPYLRRAAYVVSRHILRR